MANIAVVYADGIGTAKLGTDDGDSILRQVVNPLVASLTSHGHQVPAIKVTWPASMAGVGGTQSWDQAARVGVEDLDRIIAAHPDMRFILLGYSGGCKVIHDWLDRNQESLDHVLAVGLMSDPFRPLGKQQDNLPTQGWGVCGQRKGPIPGRTFWTTFPGDVISDATWDAVLRTLADISHVLPGAFLWELRTHIERGDLQLAWQIGVFRRDPLAWLRGIGPRLERARRDVHGYLTGAHTSAYVNPFMDGPSLADRLAATLSWAARRRLST